MVTFREPPPQAPYSHGIEMVRAPENRIARLTIRSWIVPRRRDSTGLDRVATSGRIGPYSRAAALAVQSGIKRRTVAASACHQEQDDVLAQDAGSEDRTSSTGMGRGDLHVEYQGRLESCTGSWASARKPRRFMLHRLRTAFECRSWTVRRPGRSGRNLPASAGIRKKLAGAGRGAVGKTAIVGAKDRASNKVRAEVVDFVDGDTLQSFVREHAKVRPSIRTRRRHTRGCRNSTTRRSRIRPWHGAHERHGEFLEPVEARPPRHLPQDVAEASAATFRKFTGRHNAREADTIEPGSSPAWRASRYSDLADNGLASGARS